MGVYPEGNRRAGQTGVYPERSRRAPDAVASYKATDGSQKPVNAVSGDSTSQSTGTGSPRVQSHDKALAHEACPL